MPKQEQRLTQQEGLLVYFHGRGLDAKSQELESGAPICYLPESESEKEKKRKKKSFFLFFQSSMSRVPDDGSGNISLELEGLFRENDCSPPLPWDLQVPERFSV